MPQSLSKVYVHIAFSTKNIMAVISETFRVEIQKYIVATLADKGIFTEEIYVNPDHLHILCVLPRTMTIAQLISIAKAPSSMRLKEKGIHNFHWQDGYGCFSVSASKVDVVKKYIKNQLEHHKKLNFKEELRKFFKEYGIDYKEQYVWD
jgi:putative transposase